jgi:hypothetical protein
MGVVDIDGQLALTRQRLETTAQEVGKLSPMVRDQVRQVILPLVSAVQSLTAAVEGVNREL